VGTGRSARSRIRPRVALVLLCAWSLWTFERAARAAEDAAATSLREGEIIDLAQIDRLRPHLPSELWPHRDFDLPPGNWST
jgi:hypothetical protein